MSTSFPSDYDRTLELVVEGFGTPVSKLKTRVMEVRILALWPRLHGAPVTLENIHPMQLHCSHQKREKLLCIAIGRCLNLQRPCYVVAYEVRYHTMYPNMDVVRALVCP